MFKSSCDVIGKILGHLPTQLILAVDENNISILMMIITSYLQLPNACHLLAKSMQDYSLVVSVACDFCW